MPYPGGPQLAALAAEGNPERFTLPRPLKNQGLDMSFSGLKTAMRHAIDACRGADDAADAVRADLAASFQAAVVDTLTGKCRQALEATGLTRLIVAGRRRRESRAAQQPGGARPSSLGARVYYPKPALCTDNGAMIAYTGWCRRSAAATPSLRIVARPRWPLDELVPPS